MAVLKRKLVVIEEGVLMVMSNSPTFVKEFPFLATVAAQARAKQKKRGGCGSCGRKKDQAVLYGSAKKALAGMDSTKKRRLKELLNAERVRIVYRSGENKSVELTF